jgi:hypothetical protein
MNKIKKILYDLDVKIQKHPSKVLLLMFILFLIAIIK